jgi:hypothetical protein
MGAFPAECSGPSCFMTISVINLISPQGFCRSCRVLHEMAAGQLVHKWALIRTMMPIFDVAIPIFLRLLSMERGRSAHNLANA